MKKVTLYHNPRCSKSRQTLALLEKKSIDIDVVEYLKTPPSLATLKSLLTLLDCEPRDMMRKKEKIYKELELGDTSVSRNALIKAMRENPILIERPIAVCNKKAAIGRPPENVLEILL